MAVNRVTHHSYALLFLHLHSSSGVIQHEFVHERVGVPERSATFFFEGLRSGLTAAELQTLHERLRGVSQRGRYVVQQWLPLIILALTSAHEMLPCAMVRYKDLLWHARARNKHTKSERKRHVYYETYAKWITM